MSPLRAQNLLCSLWPRNVGPFPGPGQNAHVSSSPTARRRRPRWTLAGRMLAMQFGILFVVLAGVVAVSLAQSEARLRDSERTRALAVAEWLADNPGIRGAVASRGTAKDLMNQAQSAATSGRTLEGSTTVMIALMDRRVIVSTNPLPAHGTLYLQPTEAFDGRSWKGTERGTGAAMAMTPILNKVTGATDGVVGVARVYPSVLDNLAAAVPSLVTYLGIS